MSNHERRRLLYRLAHSPWVAFGVLLLGLIVARSAWDMYKKEASAAERTLAAERELHDLQARHDTMASDVHRLSTPEGLEEALREQFQVSRPGEGVIIIPAADATGGATSTDASGTQLSWWGRVKSFFGGAKE